MTDHPGAAHDGGGEIEQELSDSAVRFTPRGGIFPTSESDSGDGDEVEQEPRRRAMIEWPGGARS